jgi:hypothetical protein
MDPCGSQARGQRIQPCHSGGVASLPVTLPRKPRDLAADLIDLRAVAARIGKEYGPAYDYAYGLRRSSKRPGQRQELRASGPHLLDLRSRGEVPGAAPEVQ